MPTFRYSAYTAQGNRVRGRREGLSLKEVREALVEEGLYPREVKPVTSSGRRRKFGAAVRSVFFRELAALLEAGLPLDRALEVLAEHPELAGGDDVLPLVRDRVREGTPLSDALQEGVPGLRDEEAAVVSAGERAGRLSLVAGELADFLEEEARVRDQIRGAMVYPLVVSLLTVVVLAVLVGGLLPVYERLLNGLDQELPALTRGVLTAGRAVRHPLGLLVIVLLLTLAGFKFRRMRKAPGQSWLQIFLHWPGIGASIAALVRARFARTCALLLQGGIALPEALRSAGRATGSPQLLEACGQAAEEVSQGQRVADAVAMLPVLGEDLPGWIRAGEAAGDLAGLLRHASRSHQRAWERGLDRALSLLEPLLIVAVGLLILAVALAMLLPMLRVNQTLGL